METQSEIFNLSQTIQYVNAGTNEETAQIEMLPPTGKDIKKAIRLAQALSRGMKQLTKSLQNISNLEEERNKRLQKENEKKAKMTEEDLEKYDKDQKQESVDFIKQALFMSEDDFNVTLDDFKSLSYSTCYLDGNKKVNITPTIFDKLIFEDVINFASTYIAVFISPSVM